MARNTTYMGFRRPPHAHGDKYASVMNANIDRIEGRLAKQVLMVDVPVANASINEYALVHDKDIVVTGVKVLSDTATASSVVSTTSWTFTLYNITKSETVATWESVNGDELAIDTPHALTLTAANADIAASDVLELRVVKTGTPTDLTGAVLKAIIYFAVKGTDA
jgi:hypothetical protein